MQAALMNREQAEGRVRPQLTKSARHKIRKLKDLAKWENVQCAFLVSPDGEELTWFATQEIKPALNEWLQG